MEWLGQVIPQVIEAVRSIPAADLLLVVLVAVVLFFVIRELRSWYWKVNKIVRLLESIDVRLALLNMSNTPYANPAPIPEKVKVSPATAEIET